MNTPVSLNKLKPIRAPIKLVAIGASTGGPPALQVILSSLPKSFSVPILIVQHMSTGFIAGFVEWLSRAADYPVHVAQAGQTPLAGHAYVAPDGLHLGVDTRGRIITSNAAPENGLRPAVSFLFRSVAASCGRQAVAVLLTGMGRDGAVGLKLLRDYGALTIAQDKETSIVHGMPGEAIKLDAAVYVLPLERIGATLTSVARLAEVSQRSESS